MNRHTTKAVIAAMSALLLASACAPTGSTTRTETASHTASQCFFTDQVRGFTAPKHDVLRLNVDRNRVFEVETIGMCNDLHTVTTIAVMSELGTNSLCAGDWARVVIPGAMRMTGPCRVRITRALTAEEIEAEKNAAS